MKCHWCGTELRKVINGVHICIPNPVRVDGSIREVCPNKNKHSIRMCDECDASWCYECFAKVKDKAQHYKVIQHVGKW